MKIINQKPLQSLTSFIRNNARKYPICKCYINSDWIKSGSVRLLIIRQQPNGYFTLATYSLRILEEGLIQTTAHFDRHQNVIDNLLEYNVSKDSETDMTVEIDYTLLHNIIYTSIADAKERGYNPHKNFIYTRFVLEDDDEKIDLIEMDFIKLNRESNLKSDEII